MKPPKPNQPGVHVPETAKPPWRDAADMVATPIIPPPELVAGLIRRGERAVIGGQSKSFKSWAALDLAICVSHGLPWIGRCTTKGNALVINLELPDWNVSQRVSEIARAHDIAVATGVLSVWTLRGAANRVEEILDQITRHGRDLSLVVIDPAYKLFTGRDENSAADVARFLAGFDRLSVETGAAVVLPTHFAKGNAAGKESMDRISGSGVFARDPDSILTMTRHEAEDAFTLEATLRTLPPMDPFVIRWGFPVFRPDLTLDPARLRQSPGRTPKYTDEALLGLLTGEALSYSDWQTAAETVLGMPKRTFDDRRKQLLQRGKVIKSATGDSYYVPERFRTNVRTAPVGAVR